METTIYSSTGPRVSVVLAEDHGFLESWPIEEVLQGNITTESSKSVFGNIKRNILELCACYN